MPEHILGDHKYPGKSLSLIFSDLEKYPHSQYSCSQTVNPYFDIEIIQFHVRFKDQEEYAHSQEGWCLNPLF